MLDPRNRRLFFEALRPPVGYQLDSAVGTTFSLDLLALVMVPLAFTEFEIPEDDGSFRPDPLLLLKAIQSRIDRVHIFCQAGQISVPRQFRGLFAYLEKAVHEVIPPQPDGVFHPKVWALRYTAEGLPVRYRLLVSSRNLTFDRSWDTLLVLEGDVADRKNAFSRNHPLGDFFAALPAMAEAVHPVSAGARAAVDLVQHELRRVDFAVPDGFDQEGLRFWPLGINRRQPSPDPFAQARIDRLLVISPFLSASTLNSLTSKGGVLISRSDELAKLSATQLSHFSSVRVLHDAANPEHGPDPAEAEEEDGVSQSPLEGLHAKLYVADAGWDARLWTGSANATHAAFERNVEFLVELAGRKRLCGIDAILGEGQGGFASLLQPYTLPDESAEPDPLEEQLEAAAEAARRALAVAGLQAVVEAGETKAEYRLGLDAPRLVSFSPGVEVTCWPLTLKQEAVSQPVEGRPGRVAQFASLSLEALTGFFAFQATASKDGKQRQVRFVLNLPLVGAPEERTQAILRSLLKNRQQVLRYLLLLLGFASPVLPGAGGEGSRLTSGWSDNSSTGGVPGLPVLEAMVRTLHQNPAQLDQVARLVEELRQTAEGQALLPDGFDAIWGPIWAVRKELGA